MQSTISLTLPCKEDYGTQVSIFSSNERCAYLPKRRLNNTLTVGEADGTKNEFGLVPGTLNHIQICAKTYTVDQRRIIINAIGKCN